MLISDWSSDVCSSDLCAMKRLIVILAAAGFASVAGAQQPTEVEQGLELDAAAVAVGTEASDAPVSDRNCLRYTGSHITASENAKARRAGKPPENCANAFCRAYDRDYIEPHDAIDVKQPLQQPAPPIHRATPHSTPKHPASPRVF